MEKYWDLYAKLSACYKKTHFLEYMRLSDDDKESICQKERQDLRNHINSDAFSHAGLLQEKAAKLESK
jgi:hypothetical protein